MCVQKQLSGAVYSAPESGFCACSGFIARRSNGATPNPAADPPAPGKAIDTPCNASPFPSSTLPTAPAISKAGKDSETISIKSIGFPLMQKVNTLSCMETPIKDSSLFIGTQTESA